MSDQMTQSTTEFKPFGPPMTAACFPFDMPYTPYTKQDKVGRVADWLSEESVRDSHYHQRQQRAHNSKGRDFKNGKDKSISSSTFGYQHMDDESSFSGVDTSGKAPASGSSFAATISQAKQRSAPSQWARPTSSSLLTVSTRRPGGGPSMQQRPSTTGATRPSHGSNSATMDRRTNVPSHSKRFPTGPSGRPFPHYHTQQNLRESSIPVGTDWELLHEFDLNKMSKLSSDLPIIETLHTFGSLGLFIKTFDKVTCKTEVPLKPIEDTKPLLHSTRSDPILQSHAQLKQNENATIYATDAILAMLMACPRSVYSWDLLVTRVGDNTVYFDRRPDALNVETMNENAPNEVYTEFDKELNAPGPLSAEATYINATYKKLVLNMEQKKKMGPTAPHDPASNFVYRAWKTESHTFVARTQLDGYVTHANKEETTLIRALNHVPGLVSNLDWRRQLDSQRGTVTATEIRNNSYKMARWTLQALLAESQWIKIGFVSRITPKDNTRHTILGCCSYRPKDLASQMNLSLSNAWGVLCHITDILLQHPEGNYLLLKDPNQANIRFFALPDSFFQTTTEAAAEATPKTS